MGLSILDVILVVLFLFKEHLDVYFLLEGNILPLLNEMTSLLFHSYY